jgi:hypothetical protein
VLAGFLYVFGAYLLPPCNVGFRLPACGGNTDNRPIAVRACNQQMHISRTHADDLQEASYGNVCVKFRPCWNDRFRKNRLRTLCRPELGFDLNSNILQKFGGQHAAGANYYSLIGNAAGSVFRFEYYRIGFYALDGRI